MNIGRALLLLRYLRKLYGDNCTLANAEKVPKWPGSVLNIQRGVYDGTIPPKKRGKT